MHQRRCQRLLNVSAEARKTQLKTYYNVTDICQVMANTAFLKVKYRGADKSLAQPGRKQATTTEDFEFHISYL
jgi:hypothetical protein